MAEVFVLLSAVGGGGGVGDGDDGGGVDVDTAAAAKAAGIVDLIFFDCVWAEDAVMRQSWVQQV